MKEVCHTICKPVHYTKDVQVCCGHWETQTETHPRPGREEVRPASPAAGRGIPAAAAASISPASATPSCVQCPPRKVLQEGLGPRKSKQQDDQLRRGTSGSASRSMVPYTVCRYVSEPETRTCNYTICHMVPRAAGAGRAPTRSAAWCPRQIHKTCTYRVCHMVPETVNKTCTYKVCHMVPETSDARRAPTPCCHMVPRAAGEERAPTRTATWCRKR